VEPLRFQRQCYPGPGALVSHGAIWVEKLICRWVVTAKIRASQHHTNPKSLIASPGRLAIGRHWCAATAALAVY
jgi:hypothetical protein